MFFSPPISEQVKIKTNYFNRYYVKKYNKPLQKVLFFLLNEGILLTLKKLKSIKIAKKIESDQEICIGIFSEKTETYIGVTRILGNRLIFPDKLIFEVSGDHAPKDVILSEPTRQLLESYLPVEPCPVPEELPDLILRDNLFLKKITNLNNLNKFISNIDLNKIDEPYKKLANLNYFDKNKVYLIGFGSYVQQYILHHFKKEVAAAVDFKASLIRKYFPTRFPIYPNLDDVVEQIARDYEPLIIISTYHSTHAEIATSVLKANPSARIFIEKPMTVRFEDAEELVKLRQAGAWIDVGFNRRYAGMIKEMKDEVVVMPRPLVITIIVKELKLPETHWYFWKNQGTRITGNLCHWIDLVQFIINSPPAEINLLNTGDTVTLAILFQDGSLVSITASDIGNDKKGVQEFIEIRGGGITIINEDFTKLTILNDRPKTIHKFQRNKGHSDMYRNLKERWLLGKPPLYPSHDMHWVPLITAKASEMLLTYQRNYKLR